MRWVWQGLLLFFSKVTASFLQSCTRKESFLYFSTLLLAFLLSTYWKFVGNQLPESGSRFLLCLWFLGILCCHGSPHSVFSKFYLTYSYLLVCMVLDACHSCSSQVIQYLNPISYKLIYFLMFETTRLPCDFDVFKKSYDFVD